AYRETELRAPVQAPHAPPVPPASPGLHLTMRGLGLEPGAEVITTPMTWPATLNTIVLAGATPVLVDIEPETFNLDTRLVERAVTPRTRAIVPVHFAGQPCDMDELTASARAHGLRLGEAAPTRARGRHRGGCGARPRRRAPRAAGGVTRGRHRVQLPPDQEHHDRRGRHDHDRRRRARGTHAAAALPRRRTRRLEGLRAYPAAAL